MDPLSQAVVGATLALAAAKAPSQIRPAAFAGMVGGLLPDLDVLIRSESDPLLGIEYHRHFTHALAFIPFGGAIAAALCWPVLRRHLSLGKILLFAMLGYATHGLLDACTNYGTHLAWPFSEARTSWNLISIVDPVFTLTLLLLVLCCARSRRNTFALWGMAFAAAYFTLGYAQRERAAEAMQQLAAARGHRVERSEVKPSFGNLVVWRAQYRFDGHYYFEAFRAGADVTHLGGESAPALSETAKGSLPEGSVQRRDLERFAFFSDDWLAPLPQDAAVIADMRFAMLPQSASPLWGIRLNPEQPQEHAAFVGLRRSRMDQITELWRMIKGDYEPGTPSAR